MSRSADWIITIDGPAASGKSTTARLVARELGWLYLDTGAMYRAVTVAVLRKKIRLDDETGIGRVAEESRVELKPGEAGLRVILDGLDVTEAIRTPEIDRAVGPVCEVKAVRDLMVAQQRRIGDRGKIVAEGRDMGTVVFPDAKFKFFMIASIEGRARRRQKDMARQGVDMALREIMESIRDRDERDSRRSNSPLRRADDALLLDTTDLTVEAQVQRILDVVGEAAAP